MHVEAVKSVLPTVRASSSEVLKRFRINLVWTPISDIFIYIFNFGLFSPWGPPFLLFSGQRGTFYDVAVTWGWSIAFIFCRF